jgi:hypothetical protein
MCIYSLSVILFKINFFEEHEDMAEIGFYSFVLITTDISLVDEATTLTQPKVNPFINETTSYSAYEKFKVAKISFILTCS